MKSTPKVNPNVFDLGLDRGAQRTATKHPRDVEKLLLRRPVKKVQISGGVGPLVLSPVPDEV
jgi:hypothetical protein